MTQRSPQEDSSENKAGRILLKLLRSLDDGKAKRLDLLVNTIKCLTTLMEVGKLGCARIDQVLENLFELSTLENGCKVVFKNGLRKETRVIPLHAPQSDDKALVKYPENGQGGVRTRETRHLLISEDATVVMLEGVASISGEEGSILEQLHRVTVARPSKEYLTEMLNETHWLLEACIKNLIGTTEATASAAALRQRRAEQGGYALGLILKKVSGNTTA